MSMEKIITKSVKFYHKDSESVCEPRLRSNLLKHIRWSKDKDTVWSGSPYESHVLCNAEFRHSFFYFIGEVLGAEDISNLYERINGVVQRLTLYDRNYNTNLQHVVKDLQITI